MMKKIFIPLSLSFILIATSCEFLNFEEGEGLSTEEIIDGLKTALEIGADSSTTRLSALDGYYGDEAVKILLPPEADIIFDNLNRLENTAPGITNLIEDKLEKLVLSINRSAEDAADDALPILGDAITGLSISEGWDILNGTVPGETYKSAAFDSVAATHYLERETKTDLIEVFSVPMNTALQKPLVNNVSAYSLWNSITSTYNNAVNIYNLVPFVTDLQTVNRDLGEFVTEKALTGLFIKVGEEEKKIRKNPYEWAEDIIQRVFGYIQDQS